MYYPIPSTYASGFYTMYGRAGEHPNIIWAEDSFAFMKLGDNRDSNFVPWIPDNLPDYFGEADCQAALPRKQIFASVHPNPFNPMTTVGYTLPEKAHVQLTVYDMLGREVATLVNGWREAGAHEVMFDGSNQASGIYIYRLRAGEFTSAGKLALMK
jgi:hypothetical protein